MKQVFRTCENLNKLFYHRSFKIVPKRLSVKKSYCTGNPSTEFCYCWRKEKFHYQLRLCNMLILEHVRKLFKWRTILVRSSKKTKVNVNFLSNLDFMFDRVEKEQCKIKLKNIVRFPRIPCIKSCLLNDFMNIYHIFDLS